MSLPNITPASEIRHPATRREYQPNKLESKWQQKWEADGLYHCDLRLAKKPFYTHVMFPYPSGDKLHIGHWYNFAPADTYARFKLMQGYEVFAPIGFDAFGLPAENYAINIRKLVDEYEAASGKLDLNAVERRELADVNDKIKTRSHPAETTRFNVQTMISQLKRMGCMYDWKKLLNTSDPEYYKWTQFVFLQMFKHGLAERKVSTVNWDPIDQTVLANEQVLPDGTAERSGAKIERKSLTQWFFKISKFADPLLNDLDALDWPAKTKLMQKNWIGRSEGVNFRMKIKGLGDPVEVYDSIPQTFLAQTFTVIAPDHPLIERIISGTENEGEVREFLKNYKSGNSQKPLTAGALSAYITSLLYGLGDGAAATFPALSQAALNEIAQLANLLAETTAPDFSVINKSFASICALAGFDCESNRVALRAKATQLLEKKIGTEVRGIFTGRYIENPFGTGDFPLWIASYVLSEYGTGVVNASSHDERDFVFAKKYRIPLKCALLPSDPILAQKVAAFEIFYREPDGKLTTPSELAGARWDEVRQPITGYIEKNGFGYKTTNYRLHDWCVSRQRYWGSPIPIVYDPQGNPHPIPEELLPWRLPTDVDFKPDGVPPLARSKELRDRVEFHFGKGWKPECDTMDTFVCSSFYSLRYLAEGSQTTFLDADVAKKWLPINLYIGGAEHATKHLLYARFVTKALYDFGTLPVKEPYQRLVHQGLITKDGHKMSKSHGNAVSPDPFVESYGADVFRMYLMFLGPYTDGGDWSDKGISGLVRFVKRVWDFFTAPNSIRNGQESPQIARELGKAVKKIGGELEHLRFNTSISSLMVLMNNFQDAREVTMSSAKDFIRLLAPFAPHLAEEIWCEYMKQESSVFKSGWPQFSNESIKDEQIKIPVQVDGKLRDVIMVANDCDEQTVRHLALSSELVRRFLSDQSKIKKTIFVPNRLINFVTGSQ